MPPRVARGKRSRPNVERSGTTLQGWEFIQETILSHDEDMIADFADDMDTLLVFAGLFSAVLTAFLVVSIVQLQPDNSALSVQLLSLIALQNGAPSHMQPFLNATAESLPSSRTFRASTIIVSVNTIWFTSLVLALAAALLGILAKQWCREYLRWHNSILPPRDNILLRQIRFDAWHHWMTPSLIGSIPAFLEIALVLFLGGLLGLVPTFSERTMTVVVSIAIVGVLLGAGVLTLLPVFSRSCSFQSPTGWAVIRGARVLSGAGWVAASVIVRLLTSNRNRENLPPLRRFQRFWDYYRHIWPTWSVEDHQDWRAYNLSIIRSSSAQASVIPGLDGFCREWQVALLRPQLAALDSLQTRVLVRALLWVRHGSSNDRVHIAIAECLPSIHLAGTRHNRIEDRPMVPSRFLSSVHVLYPTDMLSVYRMLRSFRQVAQDSKMTSVFVAPDIRGTHFKQNGPFIVPTDAEWLAEHQTVLRAWDSDPAAIEVCYSLILADILLLVDDWILAHPRTHERQFLADQIAFLLCMLQVVPLEGFRAVRTVGPRLAWQWAKTMEEFYRKLVPHTRAYHQGLISMCIELCCLLGPVRFEEEDDSDEHRIVVSKESLYSFGLPFTESPTNRVSTWATLAVNIYGISDDYSDANKRHCFVVSVSCVFETMLRALWNGPGAWKTWIGPNDLVTPPIELLLRIVQALRWSILRSSRDCGTSIPLAWIGLIVRCYERTQAAQHFVNRRLINTLPLTRKMELRPTFFLILRLLETCIHRGLLTNQTAAADFEQLLTLLDHPQLPDLPNDLTPEAVEAANARSQDVRELDPDWINDLVDAFGDRDAQPSTPPSIHAQAESITGMSLSNASSTHTGTMPRQRASSPEDASTTQDMTLRYTGAEFALVHHRGSVPTEARATITSVATYDTTTTSRGSSSDHAMHTIQLATRATSVGSTAHMEPSGSRIPVALPTISSPVRGAERQVFASSSASISLSGQ